MENKVSKYKAHADTVLQLGRQRLSVPSSHRYPKYCAISQMCNSTRRKVKKLAMRESVIHDTLQYFGRRSPSNPSLPRI